MAFRSGFRSMKSFGSVVGAIAIVACAVASEVTKVAWSDLSPAPVSLKNPFAGMKSTDLADLSAVARVHDLKKVGKKPSAEYVKAANAASARLKKNKQNVAELLAIRDKMMSQRANASNGTTKSLDGKTIELAGFILPLEFEGTKVKEFLLVPWVGACIHTPPPAPNQIVYVTVPKAIEVNERFESVVVTGKLAAKAWDYELFLQDGSDTISVAYAMSSAQVKVVGK